VTSLKTNRHLIELDLCENLIGTAEVRCCASRFCEVFMFLGCVGTDDVEESGAISGNTCSYKLSQPRDCVATFYLRCVRQGCYTLKCGWDSTLQITFCVLPQAQYLDFAPVC
jgi:hypothetical protein